jgi:glutathione S-transferase
VIDQRIVLYRCPTPTNALCPCGAVARRLRKLGLEHRTERVPYPRESRPEIEELTRQRRVPVLVDGEEVIHDSKRILQYLDWRYGKRVEPPPARRRDEAAPVRLYNLRRWILRRRQSS